jgi:phospholipase C
MSDNNFGSTFGTTVMGHQNLVGGTTHGATTALGTSSVSGKVVNGNIIANIDPLTTLDDCATADPNHNANIQMSGTNIGNLLNTKGVTWGWFYGDWIPTGYSSGVAQCVAEYDSHYTPFQYFASTANPHHMPPSSVAAIGQTDQANHQYGMTDFWNAVNNENIPAVSFIKAPANQTGHPATSSPLEEQEFLVNTINRLQATPQWREMAIIITYDDSDGWYDHVMPPIVNQSDDSANDALFGLGTNCGTTPPSGINDRCGYGPRLPLIVISPFTKENFVSHSLTDQTSITRFAEDNWGLGQLSNTGSFDAIAGSILDVFDFSHIPVDRDRTLILDPDTGEPVQRW